MEGGLNRCGTFEICGFGVCVTAESVTRWLACVESSGCIGEFAVHRSLVGSSHFFEVLTQQMFSADQTDLG